MDNLSKQCRKCKEVLSISFFSKEKRKKDGYSIYCKSCLKTYNKQVERRRDIRDEAIRSAEGISARYIQDRLSLYKSRSNGKNYPFDLDTEYLMTLWKQQDGLCFYTKQKMNIVHLKFNFWSPSLDRLDPDKGYVKGNVAWALHGVNCFKQELTLKQFLSFVNTVEWPENV